MNKQEDPTKENETGDDDAKPTSKEADACKRARAIAFLKRLFRIGYRPEKSYMRGAKS